MCPLLLSPGVEALAARPPALDMLSAAQALAAELADVLQESATLIELDLEPALGVYVAARLNELQLARPVVVLPRWPYEHATLPGETLLHALLEGANRLLINRELRVDHVCLVLDAERERPIPNRSALDGRADNRYRLLPHELPDLAALRAGGIKRLLKLTRA